MKRVLMTAAGGFVGRHCLGPLVERGYEVHGVSRRARHADISAPVTWHVADLLDARAAADVVAAAQATHLLHLAWVTTPGEYWTSSLNHDWLKASLVLVRAFARAGGKRVVGVGTCAEYDWTQGVCREDATPVRPKTVYGETKNELRLLIDAAARDHDVGFAWARLFYLFGPYEQPQRLVPTVITQLQRGQAAALSSGEQQRDYMYVKDAGEALAAVVDCDVDGAVNVASGEAMAVRDIAMRIAARCDRQDLLRFGTRPTPADEPAVVVADVTRLRDEVGFSPRVAMDKALDETISHWAQRR